MKNLKKIFSLKNYPLSIHLFFSIILLFLLFILISQTLSYSVFNNFYMNTQIENIRTETVNDYIQSLNDGTTSPSEFNQGHLAFSIIYDPDIEMPEVVRKICEKVDLTKEHVSIIDTQNSYAKTLCFVNKLDNGKTVLTLFSVQTTNKMLNTLNTYNIYVYAFIFIIIIFASWFISKKVSTPISNITHVAHDISNLDFTSKAEESSCKETVLLSKSINGLNDSLKNTIDELNRKNELANNLMIEQQKQFQMKKQLVSSISHELKTPLAIMQASISGILDGVFEPSDFEPELKNVLKEINNTSEMVQEVLDVYRLDNDSFHLEIEPLDLVHFTQKIINSFETVLQNANTKINFFYEERTIIIDGDYRQLKRVISNLFVNAIKYSPDDSTVDVKIKLINDKVLFEVTNYGVQIPEEDLKNVFEPFYRVDKSGNRTEKKKGTGLGLYIVREILEKHHFEYGNKNISNGVTFYFICQRRKNNGNQ